MTYYANTQLNKLDTPGRIFWPICSDVANTCLFSSNYEYDLYGIPSRQKPCKEILPSPVKFIFSKVYKVN